MKMVVISDNYFYRNAFSGINNCITISSEDALLINEQGRSEFYDKAVIVISIADKAILLNILSNVMQQHTLAIFVQPVQWPARTHVFCTSKVYILPERIRLEKVFSVINKCLSGSCGIFRINPGKVSDAQWNVILHLIGGISNRHLAQMLNISEKIISSRANSLAVMMGLSGLNKATQLNAMHFFYLIHTLRKSSEERIFFRKQQALILESVRNWSLSV